MPEQDPEAFDIFLEWLYTRLIKVSSYHPNEESAAESNAWWILGTKMYALAQYLQITSFGNDVIDLIGRSIIRKQGLKNPQHDAIHLVYNSTVDGCGLRNLIVSLNVWRTETDCWTVNGWKAYLEGCPAEFSQDMVVSLMRKHLGLDEDPFVNKKACQIFRDKELRWQEIRPAVNNLTEDAQPTGK